MQNKVKRLKTVSIIFAVKIYFKKSFITIISHLNIRFFIFKFKLEFKVFRMKHHFPGQLNEELSRI